MNISAFNGSISFKGGTIEQHQNRMQFLDSAVGKAAKEAFVNGERRQYEIDPEPGIAGTVFFEGDRMDRVFLMMSMPSDDSKQWSEACEFERKSRHDAWLRTELGKPPYEYPWGQVTSDYDPKGCASEIIIVYGR